MSTPYVSKNAMQRLLAERTKQLGLLMAIVAAGAKEERLLTIEELEAAPVQRLKLFHNKADKTVTISLEPE